MEQGVAHHRCPHHARTPIGGHQVIDAHTHPGLVHAQLAQTTRGREHQGGLAVFGPKPQQHHVWGGGVVHVPRLAVEALPVTAGIGNDERRAVVLLDLGGMVATNHRTDGVHEVGEAPDHYRLLGGDAGAIS